MAFGPPVIDVVTLQAEIALDKLETTTHHWHPWPHADRTFSRDFLLEHVWGYDYDGADRTVDSHVAQVRRKLGPEGARIATVWGVGYRWKSDA